MTDTKYQVAVRGFFGGRDPMAALIQRHEIQRIHVRTWDHDIPYIPRSIEPALDVLRCITAIAGGGFCLLYHWFEPPEWAAWGVSRHSFGVDSTTILRQVDLNQLNDVSKICECVSHFREMEESKRLRLRVPLDRLNRSYLAGMRHVDKAIELGIALESLFAPTKLSEGIAFAVRTRAARFLGVSFDERQETVKTLRDVYDLRSRAIHAGRFDADNSKKWRDFSKVSNILEKGQRLVGQSLVKVIVEGEPDWESFDIADAEPMQN